MGGSSRTDVQSLAILNPVMIMCCGAALFMMRQEQLKQRKLLLASCLVVFVLIAFYLVPMPEGIFGLSEGSKQLAAIRAEAGITEDALPLALAPEVALQSFFFLFAPLAVILFMIQLNRADLKRTLPLLITIGAVSSIIGVLQFVAGAYSPFYLYRITNYGIAVGLFANRNHAAVFLACQLPILATFVAVQAANTPKYSKMRTPIAIALASILILLILISGSRSGALTAVVGLLGGGLLYASANQTSRRSAKKPLIISALAIAFACCLVAIAILASRADAIDRIFQAKNDGYGRVDYWASSISLFWQYFPLGTGPGSFAPVFQKDEPLSLLGSLYLNRLHNDWLETGLTFGVPGIAILLCGVVYFLQRSYVLWFRMDGTRTTVSRGRTASIILTILGLGCVSDYPLRNPAMMCFAVLALYWFVEARHLQPVIEDDRALSKFS